MKKEYQVIWQREGMSKKRKRYATKKSADRFIALMIDPEPWKLYGYDPDAFMCCRGDPEDCGCGGKTYRESFEERRVGLPKLLTYGIQEREVGEWK
jgi:hypothetical protein